jgi:hypothetical protein
MTLVVNGRRTPVPIGPDGHVERLPTASDMASHAQIAVDKPTGYYHVDLDILPSIAPAPEVSAYQIHTSAVVQRERNSFSPFLTGRRGDEGPSECEPTLVQTHPAPHPSLSPRKSGERVCARPLAPHPQQMCECRGVNAAQSSVEAEIPDPRLKIPVIL